MLYKGVKPGQILQPADPMKDVLPLLNKIATNDLHGLAEDLKALNDKYEKHDKQAGRIETKQDEAKDLSSASRVPLQNWARGSTPPTKNSRQSQRIVK